MKSFIEPNAMSANLERSTAFSRFIRNANDEEKHKVYSEVMMRASIRQKPFSGLCCDCGTKYQTRPGTRISTFHEGRCYCCGEVKAVTEERDFGYPVYPEHPEYR